MPRLLILGSVRPRLYNMLKKGRRASQPMSNTCRLKANNLFLKPWGVTRRKIQMIVKATVGSGLAFVVAVALMIPAFAQEKSEEKKAEPAKAKAEKVVGDIGLLDTEKNYMIVVTKDGKLITLDFNAKTKATEIRETKVKMADVGLGSSATVEYVTKGEKNFLSKMEFVPAKGE